MQKQPLPTCKLPHDVHQPIPVTLLLALSNSLAAALRPPMSTLHPAADTPAAPRRPCHAPCDNRAHTHTALSYPTRTAPVRRGKWVLGQLLCEEPPPPPPGVEGLPEAEIEAGNMTLREVLELHRADPVCAACHLLMDPIGLGFENYDGIGRWRTEENGLPVDPSGELPNGSAFLGPDGLIDILVADPSYNH